MRKGWLAMLLTLLVAGSTAVGAAEDEPGKDEKKPEKAAEAVRVIGDWLQRRKLAD